MAIQKGLDVRSLIVIVTDPATKKKLMSEQITVQALRERGDAEFGDQITLAVKKREEFEKIMEKAHTLLRGVFLRGHMDAGLFYDKKGEQLYIVVGIVGGSKSLIAKELTTNISRR